MRKHLIYFALFFCIAVAATALATTPVHAQTGIITNSFEIDIIYGTDTIETPGGQVLATENDLAVTDTIPADFVPTIIASAPTEGLPPFTYPTFVQNNLGSLTVPASEDFNFLVGGNITPPALLTSQGGIVSSPSLDIFSAVPADLIGNAPIPAGVESNTLTLDNLYPVLGLTATSGQQTAVADVVIGYYTDNIVEVTPESSSLILLACGLLAFGLFAWKRRRQTN